MTPSAEAELIRLLHQRYQDLGDTLARKAAWRLEELEGALRHWVRLHGYEERAVTNIVARAVTPFQYIDERRLSMKSITDEQAYELIKKHRLDLRAPRKVGEDWVVTGYSEAGMVQGISRDLNAAVAECMEKM